MFDKLIDFILSQIRSIIPIVILFQYENGVRYRYGKYIKTLTPGIYFKIPYLETILHESIVDTTIMLPPQSIRIKGNKEIVVRASIGFSITDIGKYYNKVTDTKSAISDLGCMILRGVCIQNTRMAIECIEFGDELEEQLQEMVDIYGIKINFFRLVESTECSSYKLFNEQVRLES
jgi:regulator of protease activity HflC (stomatin/prohibitin superfamily)